MSVNVNEEVQKLFRKNNGKFTSSDIKNLRNKYDDVEVADKIEKAYYEKFVRFRIANCHKLINCHAWSYDRFNYYFSGIGFFYCPFSYTDIDNNDSYIHLYKYTASYNGSIFARLYGSPCRWNYTERPSCTNSTFVF